MLDSGSDKNSLRVEKHDGLLGKGVLRRRRDFLYVQRNGKRQVMPHFILQAAIARPSFHTLASQSSSSTPNISHRIGVTASKKVGNAVARNRAKRRMRALFRQLQPLQITPRTDYVLVARHSLVYASWTELSADLLRAAKHIQKKLNEAGVER